MRSIQNTSRGVYAWGTSCRRCLLQGGRLIHLAGPVDQDSHRHCTGSMDSPIWTDEASPRNTTRRLISFIHLIAVTSVTRVNNPEMFVADPRSESRVRSTDSFEYHHRYLPSGLLLIVVENRDLIRLSVEEPLAFLARGNHPPGLSPCRYGDHGQAQGLDRGSETGGCRSRVSKLSIQNPA